MSGNILTSLFYNRECLNIMKECVLIAYVAYASLSRERNMIVPKAIKMTSALYSVCTVPDVDKDLKIQGE